MKVYLIETATSRRMYTAADDLVPAAYFNGPGKDHIFYEEGEDDDFIDCVRIEEVADDLAAFRGEYTNHDDIDVILDNDSLEYVLRCLKLTQPEERVLVRENGEEIKYFVYSHRIKPLTLRLVAEENCYGFDPEVNGVGISEMTQHQQREVIERIIDYICSDPAAVQQFVNDFIKTNAGDYEDLGYCEQCGTHCTRWTLEI
jgi:hypothetical protein